MEIDKIKEGIEKLASNKPAMGNSLKFVFEDGVVAIDGKGEENVVTEEDIETDVAIHIKKKNFLKLVKGDLNPVTAMMMGKIKIKGDMSIAMKLKELFGQ